MSAHITCQDVLDALYELIDCEECDHTDSGKEQLMYLNKEWISYRDTIDGIIEGRIRN